MNNGKTITMLAALALALCLAAPVALAQQQQEADVLLQEALHKEMVDGDLEEAISLYQKIVNNFSDIGRAVAARALVQMGKSYEKLGVHLVAEARQAYEQVVRDYADQPKMVAEARSRLETLEAAVAAAAGPDEPKALTIRKVVSHEMYGAPSPDGRYFSYINWATGNLAVYDMKTGEYRDLTDEGTWEVPTQFGDALIWSPDSKQVAYAWYTAGNQDLRIVNVDGGEPRILAPFSAEGVPYPGAWSRDGKYILAVQGEPYHNHISDRIVLVDVETGSTRTIKNLPENIHTRNMSLSPDGKYVVHETFRKGREKPRNVHIISIDGRIDQPLIDHPADDYFPLWTPDGRGVVFTSDRSLMPGLWYVSVAEGRKASEPRLIRSALGTDFTPAGFTDDGTYYYGDTRLNENVFVAELDVDRGALQMKPEVVSKRFDGTNMIPFWSPDGSKLAYLSLRGNDWKSDLVLVIRDVQSGEERDLKPKLEWIEAARQWSSPQWSPDGNAILVTAWRGDERGLYLVDIETERATRLVPPFDGGGRNKVFTPDGDDVIFVRKGAVVHGSEIVQRNIASGAERVLGDSQRATFNLAISPDGSQLAYFEGGSGLRHDLVVVSLKDGSTRTLWSGTDEWYFSEEAGLEWMPDGAHLLLATYHPDEKQQQLYLVDARDGEQKPIGKPMKGDKQIEHVDVHPNGTTIAFSRGEQISEVWAIENLVFEQ